MIRIFTSSAGQFKEKFQNKFDISIPDLQNTNLVINYKSIIQLMICSIFQVLHHMKSLIIPKLKDWKKFERKYFFKMSIFRKRRIYSEADALFLEMKYQAHFQICMSSLKNTEGIKLDLSLFIFLKLQKD